MLAVWSKCETATVEMDFEIQINKTSALNARRVWRPVHNWVTEHGWIISLETVWIQAQNLMFILAVYGSWEPEPRSITLLGLTLLLSHLSREENLILVKRALSSSSSTRFFQRTADKQYPKDWIQPCLHGWYSHFTTIYWKARNPTSSFFTKFYLTKLNKENTGYFISSASSYVQQLTAVDAVFLLYIAVNNFFINTRVGWKYLNHFP